MVAVLVMARLHASINVLVVAQSIFAFVYGPTWRSKRVKLFESALVLSMSVKWSSVSISRTVAMLDVSRTCSSADFVKLTLTHKYVLSTCPS